MDVLGLTFEKIESDYKFVAKCLREVLNDIGLPEVGAAVDGEDETADPMKEMHALSIVFQLINLVEENAVIQTRRWRESEEATVPPEPGLWWKCLEELKGLGVTEKDVRAAPRTPPAHGTHHPFPRRRIASPSPPPDQPSATVARHAGRRQERGGRGISPRCSHVGECHRQRTANHRIAHHEKAPATPRGLLSFNLALLNSPAPSHWLTEEGTEEHVP
jgi:hypothetical protein